MRKFTIHLRSDGGDLRSVASTKKDVVMACHEATKLLYAWLQEINATSGRFELRNNSGEVVASCRFFEAESVELVGRGQ